MITFTKMDIEGFQIIDRESVDLEDQGYVLITGRNGHGKTTLVCAFLWCLFGKTSKGSRGDSVINKMSGAGCRVSVAWREHGRTIRVDRYRKHKGCPKETTKSGVFVYVDGVQQSHASDSSADAQVEQLLGSDFSAFTHTIVFGQHLNRRLPELEESEKQALWDRILDIEWLKNFKEYTRDQVKAVTVSRAHAEGTLSTTTAAVQQAEAAIGAARTASGDYQAALDAKKAVVSAQILKLGSDMEALSIKLAGWLKELASTPDPEPLHNLAEYDNRIAEIGVAYDTYHSEATDNMAKGMSVRGGLEAQIKSLEAKLKSVRKLGVECDSCLQSVPEGHRGRALKQLEATREPLKQDLAVVEAKLLKLRAQIAGKKTAAGVAQEKVRLERQQSELLNESIRESIRKRAELVREIAAARAQLATLDETKQLRQGQLDDVEFQHAREAKELAAKEENLATAKMNKSQAAEAYVAVDMASRLVAFWDTAAGSKGIRTHLVAQAIPFLNTAAERYSDLLCHGKIRVKFKAAKTLASGAVKEGFFEEVQNDREVTEYAEFSGGERQLSNIIIGLSLQDLVSSRSVKRYNICWMDECVESLDQDNIQAVILLLADLAKQRGSVFVVTHNEELKPYFTKEIKMIDGRIHNVR